jgi:hypothetical protein
MTQKLQRLQPCGRQRGLCAQPAREGPAASKWLQTITTCTYSSTDAAGWKWLQGLQVRSACRFEMVVAGPAEAPEAPDTSTNTYASTSKRTSTRHRHVYMPTQVQVHAHVHIHIFRHKHQYIHKYIHKYTSMYKSKHTYMYIYMYKRKHNYMCTCMCL